jgi:hypothetical protein
MTGPYVVLALVLVTIPIILLLLRLDAWMTEREFDRRLRGNEVDRFAKARAAIRHQQESNPGHIRLGHKNTGK